MAALIGALGLPGAASAHQAPDNCQGNGLRLDITRDRAVVRVGETATFFVYASNDGPSACWITSATVYLQKPGADGQPVAESQAVVVGSNLDFAPGALSKLIGTVTIAMTVNDGIKDAVVRAFTAGVLHDADTDHNAAIQKTLGTNITRPSITIDKTGSIQNGQAPQNVTYTYEVTNTSSTPVPLVNVTVSDDLCATPTYSSGDNGDGVLSNGEKWYFTCSKLHQNPGVYTNTAKACAVSRVDFQPVCSPPDTWTVTLTAPPGPAAQGAVKPQAVANDKCTLSTPSGLKVRKGEVTTVKLTVRNVDAGSTARLTLPGGKVLSAKTNSKGVATFKIKPTKTGTATIKVAECSDVERLTVRPARQVVSRQVPKVTG
jgi:uncharacterized repeat protein (TIGR01451 family)